MGASGEYNNVSSNQFGILWLLETLYYDRRAVKLQKYFVGYQISPDFPLPWDWVMTHFWVNLTIKNLAAYRDPQIHSGQVSSQRRIHKIPCKPPSSSEFCEPVRSTRTEYFCNSIQTFPPLWSVIFIFSLRSCTGQYNNFKFIFCQHPTQIWTSLCCSKVWVPVLIS